ncbi:MAG TPA: SpoIID/LytB domain-containing protein [Pyrinomonadaceae bacterium]
MLCLVLCGACTSTARDGAVAPSGEAQASVNEDEVDAALERAARASLGEREGTILVMDAQNGRLRAVVNPRIAFEQAFPPGSAIKPFTALAAMRAGLIDAETHKLCPAHYAREGFQIACTHPQTSGPIDLAQALAYSCNYYFATVGERLSAGAFDATLASFGFGERTGVNATGEAAGALQNGGLSPGDVLGEGDHLLVTPVQMATAYAALLNGGHLYRPKLAGARGFKAEQSARINIAAAHRATLLKGMRGALQYGTAAGSGLDGLALEVYGKTGTSTSSNGFRTQGWFVAVADEAAGGQSGPQSVSLVVLVFLRRAHGAEGARLARPVFEEYLRARQPGAQDSETETASRADVRDESHAVAGGSEGEASASSAEAGARGEPASVGQHFRVKLTSRSPVSGDVESRMLSLSLEEYLTGVLAAESSIETEPEALKAQAVISRTFALKNMGRHSAEGFDLCSTTHCQRYSNFSSAHRAGVSAAIERAVRETGGETLRDGRGELAEVYFHAACGGMTANIKSLWGAEAGAQSYLRGVRDDYCATMPHHHWTETITAERLLKALRSDPRTDVGARLTDVLVSRRDATARAETVTLEGERRKTVRGWDFKLIVGRALGWNVLKSSRFAVERSGAAFVFRGGGFGHGLGLCQEGAHVMARRGLNYRRIIENYFPGTSILGPRGGDAPSRAASSAPASADRAHLAHARLRRRPPAPGGFNAMPEPFSLRASQQGRLTLASEHFRASYPARVARREVEAVLGTLEAARRDLERRLTTARLPQPAPGSLEVIIHETTPAFIASTGLAGWAAAASRGSRIELQPLALLRRRGVLTTTLRHEYAHVVIEQLGRGRTARWLAEGLAVHVAGEGAMLAPFSPRAKWRREELERKLDRPAASAAEMRSLYAAAYEEVRALVRSEGEASLWRRVAQNSD